MIKFETNDVWGFEWAFKGMRNPMNSWDKSDSNWLFQEIGENDLALARKLINAGSEHRKFLRQIYVSVDITAPRFWWAEFDTYKIGVTANSTSTMHTIHKKPFERKDFSVEYICKIPQNRVPIIVETEEWRETEYEGVYVSNSGKVKQAAREIVRSDGKVIHLPEREIAVTEDDYLRVKLHTTDGIHSCKLHRLMAKAFIDNPNNYPVVNHKDGNKLNCNLDNLEWCSRLYNIRYSKVWTSNERPVLQYDKEGNFIKEYKKFFKSVIKTMDETVIINMYIIHFITTYYKSKLARFKLILQKTEKAIKNIHSSYSKEMQSKFDENFQL